MQPKTTVIIADDHPIVRQGLVKIIDQEDTYEIIAECGDGQETLRLIKELMPDIVLLDISMPGIDGLQIIKKSTETNTSSKFIILTMYDDAEYFNHAMELGVKGYLLKENAVTQLMECLTMVSKGKHYICPEVSGHLINRQFQKEVHSPFGALTRTERQILELIAENKTSREIANELVVSLRTIQNHRNNIAHKLGLKGHNKLLQFALENKKFL
jgi:DNA-binding NarL/FixJ family response regulator